MDVLRWVVFGVLPALGAVAVGVGAGGPRLLALAFAIALCVPFVVLGNGVPPWPWALSLQRGAPFAWLFWLLAASGLVGVGYDTRALWKPLLIVADVALVAALPWLLTGELRARWTFEQGVGWLLGMWLAIALPWWVLRRVGRVQPGLAVPLAGTIVFAGDALVLRAHGAGLSWQLAGVGAIALAMAVATTTWRRPFRCGTGATMAIALAHVGLLLAGHAERDLLRPALLLAAASPLPMLLASARTFVQRPKTGITLALLATAGVAASAVLVAASRG